MAKRIVFTRIYVFTTLLLSLLPMLICHITDPYLLLKQTILVGCTVGPRTEHFLGQEKPHSSKKLFYLLFSTGFTKLLQMRGFLSRLFSKTCSIQELFWSNQNPFSWEVCSAWERSVWGLTVFIDFCLNGRKIKTHFSQ